MTQNLQNQEGGDQWLIKASFYVGWLNIVLISKTIIVPKTANKKILPEGSEQHLINTIKKYRGDECQDKE